MEDMDNLRERIDSLEDHTHRVERRLRWWRGIACTVVMLALLNWTLPSSVAKDGKPMRVKDLETRIEVLESKLEHVTSGPDELTISGANLHIVNGLGTTNTANGLGNLIVGYNEVRTVSGVCNPPIDPFCTDTRTGSHNVVVGEFHNLSSFGGLIAGFFNEISGPFASVSGGLQNIASGSQASVSGGNGNKASGAASSVSGGGANTASRSQSWVSGGSANTASGQFASVAGGFRNTASGDVSSISGGVDNTASGANSSVSGGADNTASGDFSSVSGGHNRSAPGQFNWAAGPLFADN
jgi:trimeric autotransporter adhesin